MISFQLNDVIPIINAKLFGKNKIIHTISTDSRTIINKGCLFVALKGNKFDAHNFLNKQFSSLIQAILVDHYLPLDIPQLVVTDTRYALGKLAFWIRQKVKTKIVAITGSSGKTSVKEMTASILRECGQVLSTEDNFNNDIGVALTLLRLTPKYDFAVIELGGNNLGEIFWTTNLVRPKIALVNNIYASHILGFGSIKKVAEAKGEIFSGLANDGLGIINAESNDLLRWKYMLYNKKIFSFGLPSTNGVNYFATNIVNNSLKGTNFILHTPKGNFPVFLPLLGLHNIFNALAASSLALSIGANFSSIIDGLSKFKKIPGRLFSITLEKNKLLLDDTYNSNVGSMIAAIQILKDLPGYRVMAIGDMYELGSNEIEYHRQIGLMIAKTSIDKVLSIGCLSKFIGDLSGDGRGEHFNDKKSMIFRLKQLIYKYEVITILVKGSRNSNMEQVIDGLNTIC